MKSINSILFAIAVLIGSGSCTETNTVVEAGQKPIVEAYLATGTSVSMRVYTEISYSENSDGKSSPVSNLSITLTGSDGRTFTLRETTTAGTYQSASGERIGPAGTTYTLRFTYQNGTISATTTIPPRPANFRLSKTQISRTKIDFTSGSFPSFGGDSDDNTAIEATWSNPDNAYHFVAAQVQGTSPEQVIKLPDDITLPSVLFTNEPVVGTSTSLTPQNFEYFGQYKIILYRVNADYAALYRSSGTTTQNLSTPPSSIDNGLGIFTGINADTLSFTVQKK